LFVKRDVCFSKNFQDGNMKSGIFASPQMHQSAAWICFFNYLICFDQFSNECDVASAAEDGPVWKF